jgi:tRNA-dihydrouridine synthase 2
VYYTLSTVEASNPPVPHSRTVVHRGFVNEQRSNESKTGVEPFDPNFGSNACLVTTTDIRAPKAQHIIQNYEKNGTAKGEVNWWMEGKNQQFRLAGTLFLVPQKNHPSTKLFDLKSISPLLNKNSEATSTSSFDWYKERTRIFEKLSPGLLASFARPTPGSKHPQEGSGKLEGKGPGEGGEDDGKDDLESPWPLELPQPGKEENEQQKKQLAESESK